MEQSRYVHHEWRAHNELGGFFCPLGQVTDAEVQSLRDILNRNPDESDMHRFLELHPKFLTQILTCHHGRFQISKQRLGSEYVPDFLLAELCSSGLQWQAVELESPKETMYRSAGQQSAALTHAIQQIRDWRSWLKWNNGYAARPKFEYGLGLIGIDCDISGIIIMGRRGNYPSRFDHTRDQMLARENILVHSYDWLLGADGSNRSG